MSLVGSLEDLGLGDILQIICLSRKSGVLQIRSGQGEGHLVFREGLIRSAFLKAGPTDLRELILHRRLLPAPDAEAAFELARARARPFEDLLVEQSILRREEIDALRREYVEGVVLEMFRWPEGDFSFEMREPERAERTDLSVSDGVNPQFLALEGTRLRDEEERDFAPDGEDDDGPMVDEDPTIEGMTPLSPDAVAAAPPESVVPGELLEGAVEEALVLATVQHVDRVPEVAEPRAAEPRPETLPPVVVIDGVLQVLEWTKNALGSIFPRVHIFQRTELGIARIRQYLARAEIPLVLLSPSAPADPISGAADFREIRRRLKAQVPRMAVLRFDVARGREEAPGANGPVVARPGPAAFADPRREEEREAMAEALRRDVLACVGPGRSAPAAPSAHSPETLRRLKEASARLRDPSSGVDVLRLVLEFAGHGFSRVALFVVREGTACGIAQQGLPRAGGPDERALREIRLPAAEPAWFRSVLDTRAARRAAPADAGDEALAVLLGNGIPQEAYVAPIESGDQVVALLYADNLPAGTPIGDTSALEVVLHEAGLALDRAVVAPGLRPHRPAGSP